MKANTIYSPITTENKSPQQFSLNVKIQRKKAEM